VTEGAVVSVREQAIEAAIKAAARTPGFSAGIAAALDAAVPVLLNDLADRIEHQRFTAIAHPYDTGYNAAVDDMLGFVRAAAEGWTE
jgi:hypothetical protein